MPRPATGRIFEPRPGRRVIDQRAWCWLERCRRKLRLDEIPLPVPVEQWIEGPLGIRFGFTDLSHLGPDVLGAAFVADREILVDDRVLQHEGRLRFTCAHELGHLVLHRNTRSVFQELATLGPYDSPDHYERHADRFAAAFLMPVPLVERELIRILDARGLKRGKAVLQLMEPTLQSEWLWRRIVLPEFTRRFAVSLSAAVHRFNDLQPNLPQSWPLLPRELVEVLLKPADDPRRFDGISIHNGVVADRSLFDLPKTESGVA